MTQKSTDDLIADIVKAKHKADSAASMKQLEELTARQTYESRRSDAVTNWRAAETEILNEVARRNRALAAADIKLDFFKMDKPDTGDDIFCYKLHIVTDAQVLDKKFNATFHPNINGETKVWINDTNFNEAARHSFVFTTADIDQPKVDEVINALLAFASDGNL